MRWLLLILLLLGCQETHVSNIQDSIYTCDNGMKVADKSYCSDVPEASGTGNVEPIIHQVDDTDVKVEGQESAEDAFAEYVKNNRLDYEFVSSEFYETKEGVDFYKVVYRHHELSGGVRQLLVDSNGKVYDLVGVI